MQEYPPKNAFSLIEALLGKVDPTQTIDVFLKSLDLSHEEYRSWILSAQNSYVSRHNSYYSLSTILGQKLSIILSIRDFSKLLILKKNKYHLYAAYYETYNAEEDHFYLDKNLTYLNPIAQQYCDSNWLRKYHFNRYPSPPLEVISLESVDSYEFCKRCQKEIERRKVLTGLL